MNLFVLLFYVALIVAVVVFFPMITIWALNTLFPALAIPINLATWFAVLWLGASLSSPVWGNKK